MRFPAHGVPHLAPEFAFALQMDGFEPNEGVIVMAATNMQENLDAALTRPGRFDRHVAVPLPDVRGRLEILNYYLQVRPAPEEATYGPHMVQTMDCLRFSSRRHAHTGDW